MKIKVSVLVLEIDENVSVPQFNILLTDENSIPSKILTTRSLEQTIQEIYSEFTHLKTSYANPILSDFRTEGLEAEVLYITTIPHGISGVKKGRFVPHSNLGLKHFYEQHVIERPRSVSQQPSY
jgi:hypothetical protein|tara:strand:- start:2471 stop:2842 length:372 start_codon:yes stop_codon:yes gene_type:complete